MTASEPWTFDVGGLMVQCGCAKKTSADLTVDFATPSFGRESTVCISPFWAGQRCEVGAAETIVGVNEDGSDFSLCSGNAADNYFVTWVAVGPREARPLLASQSNGLSILHTNLTKELVSHSVGWPEGLFGGTPNFQVSPFWRGGSGGAAHAETINSVTAESAAGASDNVRSDRTQLVSTITTGPSAAGSDGVDTFSVGEMLIETGVVPKVNSVLRHPFKSRFAAPPVVLVSPFLARPTSGVNREETINDIRPNFFEVASGNSHHSDYFVSFLAIGPAS